MKRVVVILLALVVILACFISSVSGAGVEYAKSYVDEEGDTSVEEIDIVEMKSIQNGDDLEFSLIVRGSVLEGNKYFISCFVDDMTYMLKYESGTGTVTNNVDSTSFTPGINMSGNTFKFIISTDDLAAEEFFELSYGTTADFNEENTDTVWGGEAPSDDDDDGDTPAPLQITVDELGKEVDKERSFKTGDDILKIEQTGGDPIDWAEHALFLKKSDEDIRYSLSIGSIHGQEYDGSENHVSNTGDLIVCQTNDDDVFYQGDYVYLTVTKGTEEVWIAQNPTRLGVETNENNDDDIVVDDDDTVDDDYYVDDDVDVIDDDDDSKDSPGFGVMFFILAIIGICIFLGGRRRKA